MTGVAMPPRGARHKPWAVDSGRAARQGTASLFRAARDGQVAEWLKAADCKSARASVRWFESSPVHHSHMAPSRIGAGSGNRTRVFSLEGCCTTIVLYPRPSLRRGERLPVSRAPCKPPEGNRAIRPRPRRHQLHGLLTISVLGSFSASLNRHRAAPLPGHPENTAVGWRGGGAGRCGTVSVSVKPSLMEPDERNA